MHSRTRFIASIKIVVASMCILFIVNVLSALLIDAACTNQTELFGARCSVSDFEGRQRHPPDMWKYLAYGLAGMTSICMLIVYIIVVDKTAKLEIKYIPVDIV
jgi:hypothetical protein